MTNFEGFPADTFRFLKDLSANNNRDWFAENKQRYEQSFLEPALQFITALEKPLDKCAPMLQVQAKKSGGSLMRIYKDTRFSKDKTPYKTNIGIHFRHRAGKDVHAPGVYVHIADDECFFGSGIWRPASDALKQIRSFISDNPSTWNRFRKSKKYNETFELHDDRLKSAPRGIEKDHPLLDDLRLKSFIGTTKLTKKDIKSPELVSQVAKLVTTSKPLMVILAEALNQPY